ncbi:hypothetical protein Aeqsu_1893 [Aequorivita sublithincola DSM 14238]|uniref:DUF1735 domain-containing protein n=1 Tax=Aequorivita sublithincola (strain DSM 14238 / LMG 21431 / ACAM 643 / 9-3) TaxID=746697 RepID=I3YWK0_AEQSU|nr:hypothetical protein [Aequorivita sublithincola]AFL81368.1 hypothetical protein Aeqsu_1893 [Aequorivita sublithincola DSM 14238]
MNKSLVLSIFMVCACLFFTACIKDTDFDQAEDIALTPVIELDLIYFNLQANRFFDTINSVPIFTVRDTTLIKFLDDSTLQESLKRAEFFFKFTNSIPRDFQVNFQFLSELNDTTYVAGTSVASGTKAAPVITEFTENVEGEAILSLTQAQKVVVSVTIPSSNENLEGILNLKSKTTYYLEY